MKTPYDIMAKGLAEGALTGPCEVHTEMEVVSDAQSIDVVVVPDPARVGELTSRGWLGRMGSVHCVIEAFHDPPSPELLDACQLKVTAMHMRQRAVWEGAPKDSRGEAPTRAMLWVVCATRPDRAMRAWAIDSRCAEVPACSGNVRRGR